MARDNFFCGLARKLAASGLLILATLAQAQTDALASWNDGAAKQAIINFVKETTDKSSAKYLVPEARIATFDQDGTTWVEQPNYGEAMFAFDRLAVALDRYPRLKYVEPFKTIMSGNQAAIARLTSQDLLKVAAVVTHSGMTVPEFQKEVQAWMATARHPRFKRAYADLAFLPMVEAMQYLRANGFKTYIVTGGGQDFVREYAQQVYGVPPEQVIGSAADTTFGYDKTGKAVLTKTHKMLYLDDGAGKPLAIHLVIGARPVIAFGNSDGDRQMLEYAQAGDGAHLMLLVHHDDAVREYAYGPSSPVGTFSDALMSEAKRNGWIVISMKSDWKKIFAWE